MPEPLAQFSVGLADLEVDDVGSLTARLVPFNTPMAYGSGRIQFAQGGLTVPAGTVVPLTIDHGTSVLDRVGVMKAYTVTPAKRAVTAILFA